MRPLSLLALCLCVGLLAAQEKKPANESTGPIVSVIGLTVERPIPGDQSMPQSTQIKLFVKYSGKKIVAIDHDKSSLTSLTDDKGTDLTKGKYPARIINNNELRLLGSDSGLLYIHLPGISVPEAQRVKLKGTLALICGKEIKQAEAANLLLRKGEELKVGPAIVRVIDAMGGNVQLSYDSPTPVVNKIEFFNDKGKRVPTIDGGGLVPLAGPYRRPTPTIVIFDKVDSVNVKVSYFDSTEVVTIPLDLNIGVGLGP